MARFIASALVGIAAVAVAGCSKPSGPVATPAPVAVLAIDGREDADFGSGTKSITWRLGGTGVRKLTARLVVFADGKPAGRTDIDCDWGGPSGAVDGRLTLLIEDGKAFGAPGKCAHRLTLTFPAGGPSMQSAGRVEPKPVAGPGDAASTSSVKGSLPALGTLYAEVRGPAAHRAFAEPVKSDEALGKLSAEGGVSVGVIVEWQP